MIGDNKRSGLQVMRKNWDGRKRAQYYKFNDLRMIYPQYADHESKYDKAMKYENRRMRILMRGIKLGKKKGGIKQSVMDIFQIPKKEETKTE
jgi:hypothetical protein